MSSPASRPIPRTFGATFDHRRNSSAVRPVSPFALKEALGELRALRRREPALCKWIADGAPTLTEAEHVERFGEPYRAPSRARR